MLVIGRIAGGRQHRDGRLVGGIRRHGRRDDRNRSGIIVHRRDAMVGDEIGEQPDHALAVFQHRRRPTAYGHIVLENVKSGIIDADDVDACDMHTSRGARYHHLGGSPDCARDRRTIPAFLFAVRPSRSGTCSTPSRWKGPSGDGSIPLRGEQADDVMNGSVARRRPCRRTAKVMPMPGTGSPACARDASRATWRCVQPLRKAVVGRAALGFISSKNCRPNQSPTPSAFAYRTPERFHWKTQASPMRSAWAARQ